MTDDDQDQDDLNESTSSLHALAAAASVSHEERSRLQINFGQVPNKTQLDPRSSPDTDMDDNKSISPTALSPGLKSRRKSRDTHKMAIVTNWLKTYCVLAPAEQLPRQTLFAHYVSYCNKHHYEPAISATFGKGVKAVFPNVKTRRLGTRADSKYHLVGLALSSKLLLNDTKQSPTLDHVLESLNDHVMDRVQPKQYHDEISDLLPTIILPQAAPELCQQASRFATLYHDYCRLFLSVIKSRLLDGLHNCAHKLITDAIAQGFYDFMENTDLQAFITACDSILYDACLNVLVPSITAPLTSNDLANIRKFSKSYPHDLNQLFTDIEKSRTPVPKAIAHAKVTAARLFCGQLKRLCRIHHLKQSVSSFFTATSNEPDDLLLSTRSGKRPFQEIPSEPTRTHLERMSIDWSSVNVDSITGQSEWILGSECSKTHVHALVTEFGMILDPNAVHSVDDVITFIDLLVDRYFSQLKDNNEREHVSSNEMYILVMERGRLLVLKWSFVCSLVMHDLTLRSASSFGLFHILKLFVCEYLQHVVESQYLSQGGYGLPSGLSQEYNSDGDDDRPDWSGMHTSEDSSNDLLISMNQ